MVNEGRTFVFYLATHLTEGARCSSMVRAFSHGVVGRRINSFLSYFSFQPVLHDWCNKGRGMCCPVCGVVHINYP